jgi:hypothetical protein
MKIPGKATISNRTSTMASQFARARAPYFIPSAEQFAARYKALGMDPVRPECIYCGGPPTEWDHLRPMVKDSRWTGFFTEIANLVPACGKCNQSRGSKPVKEWMTGSAQWSPFLIFQTRNGLNPTEALLEVKRRISIIDAVMTADPPRCLEINIDDELEIALEDCRIELNTVLRRAEEIAAKLRSRYQSLAAAIADT